MTSIHLLEAVSAKAWICFPIVHFIGNYQLLYSCTYFQRTFSNEKSFALDVLEISVVSNFPILKYSAFYEHSKYNFAINFRFLYQQLCVNVIISDKLVPISNYRRNFVRGRPRTPAPLVDSAPFRPWE